MKRSITFTVRRNSYIDSDRILTGEYAGRQQSIRSSSVLGVYPRRRGNFEFRVTARLSRFGRLRVTRPGHYVRLNTDLIDVISCWVPYEWVGRRISLSTRLVKK